MHNWTIEDDIVTLYVYLYGNSKINLSIKDLGEKLGMGFNSFKARMNNFKAIENKGGFTHYAASSLSVYNQYKNLSENELYEIVNNILKNLINS